MTGSESLVADAQGQRGGHLGGKEEARCQVPTFSCSVILTLSKEDTQGRRDGDRGGGCLWGFLLGFAAWRKDSPLCLWEREPKFRKVESQIAGVCVAFSEILW